MKAVQGMGRRISFVAALVALMLGGVLAWEWEQGRALERSFEKMRKLSATAVPEMTVLPEFGLPDAESGFPELLARPMFFTSRRPMASANQGESGGMKKGQFVLVGVVIAPNQHSALLRNVESNKTATVAMGGQVGGMTLGEVEANKVVLRLGAESEELALKVQVGSKPPSPVSPAMSQAQPQPPVTPPARPAAVQLPPPRPTPTVPRELSPEEKAVAEKQYKAMIDARVKKGLPLPDTPPPWAAKK